MFSVKLIKRSINPIHKNSNFLSTTHIKFKKDSATNNSDKETKSEEAPKKKAEAASKLQNLIKLIVSEQGKEEKGKELKLAKPVKKVVEKREVYKVKLKELNDNTMVKLVTAVKDVADEIGGDVQKTESELLNVLLKNTKPDEVGKKDEKPVNLNELITGMKIDKTPSVDQSKAGYVRRVLSDRTEEGRTTERFRRNDGLGRDRRRHAPQDGENWKQPIRRREERVSLFGAKPLGIFTATDEAATDTDPLETWARLEKRELELLTTQPPRNVFEEMILWTNQGKLWTFPIDNECCNVAEDNIEFSEHVFLTHHLEPWCPQRGPIRHFMELVCVGLSKNPYITPEAKKDHILWFRDYFDSKQKILKEVGALGTEEETNKLLEA